MHPDEALTELPDTYQRALQLAAAGWSVEAIARDLQVDVAAVRSLLSLAEAKLARIAARDLDAEPGS